MKSRLGGLAGRRWIMLGAILVVSGPTVVAPLLNFVRPSEGVQRLLIWEGSLIDPVGGILGALVFHAVIASSPHPIGYELGQFLASVGVGVAGGAVGTALLWLLLRRLRLAEVLGTLATVASVIAVAAACDILRDDAGLIAAILMGLAMANLRGLDVAERRPFFETVIQLVIGVLFVSISATVTPDSLKGVALPALGLVAALVLVVRPLVTLTSTLRTDLSKGERGFVGWMAPRGIVAASTASAFSVTLVAHGIGGASKILPATFLVIVATVTLYGLTASPVARLLRVTPRPAPGRCWGDEVLFDEPLTRIAISIQHHHGARIVRRPAGDAIPDGYDLLFVVRADGRLAPVTEHGRPVPETGDTLVLLGPAQQPARVTPTGTVATLGPKDS